VLGGDSYFVSDQVSRVEADTKLTNHTNVSARLQRLHERLCARASDRAQIVDQIGLGHANARVDQGQRVRVLVGYDLDVELFARVELVRVGERLVADFVQGVRRVRHQLTQEDLLVRVERVDDQTHELSDLCLKCKGLNISG